MIDSGEFHHVDSNHSGRFSFVSSQPAVIPSSRSMLSCHKRWPLGTSNTSGSQGNVLVTNFLHLIRPKIIIKEFIILRHKERRDQFPKRLGQGPLLQEMESEKGHTSNADVYKKAVDHEFIISGERQQISELQFDKFRPPSSFLCWKIRFKKPSDYLFLFSIGGRVVDQRSGDGRIIERIKILPIKRGKNFSNFEMLDAKIASALQKITKHSHFKKKVSLEEQNAQKEDPFLRGRRIAFMIHDLFRVTGAHDTVFNYADLFSVTLRDDNPQEFDTRWDEVLLSMSKIPPDDVLESLYKLRTGEADQFKTVLEMYVLEIRQKISMLNYQKLKTMTKRSIDQKLGSRNFDARHGSGQESKGIKWR